MTHRLKKEKRRKAKPLSADLDSTSSHRSLSVRLHRDPSIRSKERRRPISALRDNILALHDNIAAPSRLRLLHDNIFGLDRDSQLLRDNPTFLSHMFYFFLFREVSCSASLLLSIHIYDILICLSLLSYFLVQVLALYYTLPHSLPHTQL